MTKLLVYIKVHHVDQEKKSHYHIKCNPQDLTEGTKGISFTDPQLLKVLRVQQKDSLKTKNLLCSTFIVIMKQSS